jgi:hypothetical protein
MLRWTLATAATGTRRDRAALVGNSATRTRGRLQDTAASQMLVTLRAARRLWEAERPVGLLGGESLSPIFISSAM